MFNVINSMKNKFVLSLLVLLFVHSTVPSLTENHGKPSARDSLQLKSNDLNTRVDSVKPVQIDSLRKLQNDAFRGGEYLKFDVNYQFITVGEAVMKISDTLYHGNRKCLKIYFNVDTKPFFDLVYKVRDRYRTYVDVDGLFPWRFEQHIREGGFSRDFTAEFDQLYHIARTSEGNHPIPMYVHDILSAFYFARTIDYSNFKPGQKIHLQNFYKDSTYELDVRFKGRQEIEVAAGKFKCIVIEPLAKEGGLFKSEGKVYVWLTDDERKIPVRVSSKVVIGSIDSELVEYDGINGPINAKINDD